MARKNGQMFSFSTKSFPWCFPLRCWCCCARDMPEKCWLKWSKHTLECQRHTAGDAACFLASSIVSLTLFVFLLVVLFFFFFCWADLIWFHGFYCPGTRSLGPLSFSLSVSDSLLLWVVNVHTLIKCQLIFWTTCVSPSRFVCLGFEEKSLSALSIRWQDLRLEDDTQR